MQHEFLFFRPPPDDATGPELLGLLDRVVKGEEIFVRRDGRSVARLTALSDWRAPALESEMCDAV